MKRRNLLQTGRGHTDGTGPNLDDGYPPPPWSFCVKAIDKGVRGEIDGEATNKGVSRELVVKS